VHLNLPRLYCRLLVPVQGIVNFVHIQCFVVFQSTLHRVITYDNKHVSFFVVCTSPYLINQSIIRFVRQFMLKSMLKSLCADWCDRIRHADCKRICGICVDAIETGTSSWYQFLVSLASPLVMPLHVQQPIAAIRAARRRIWTNGCSRVNTHTRPKMFIHIKR